MIAEDDEIVVIGSQAVLGQFPRAPEELLVSIEADVYPRNRPERADLIDGSIGEASPFQQTFGYYAHGVSPSTAVLPAGWQDRLIPVQNENTRNAIGWCLEVHDLALSKYTVGREKDLVFTRTLAAYRMTEKEVLLERLHSMPLPTEHQELVRSRVERDFSGD